jgi:rSAM/selenodomain-associated transferase 2
VVIPTRNEESVIAAAVTSALDAGAVDVIVSDGESNDDTMGRATAAGATTIIQSPPGRGTQLNRGAAAAAGDVVLFLHADNRLSTGCLRQICQCGAPQWGAFRQQIESPGLVYRLLESGNAMRVKIRRMPFGDQAIFVNKELLDQQGGIADIALMEDVELSRRLRRSARPLLLEGPVFVDPRRWRKRGVLRQTLRNWTIQAAYALGVPAARLNSWYR